MLEGSCDCGKVRWTFTGAPESVTACNCTLCRRYGALWLYGHENEEIYVSGTTRIYLRGERVLEFHFCPDCGCIAWWRGVTPGEDGRRRIGVNARLAAPESVAALAIHHFDGLESWQRLPNDGSCVSDIWF
jgi:hypothetical protein